MAIDAKSEVVQMGELNQRLAGRVQQGKLRWRQRLDQRGLERLEIGASAAGRLHAILLEARRDVVGCLVVARRSGAAVAEADDGVCRGQRRVAIEGTGQLRIRGRRADVAHDVPRGCDHNGHDEQHLFAENEIGVEAAALHEPPQALAQRVEAEHRQEEGQGRIEDHPRAPSGPDLTVGHHRAPLRDVWDGGGGDEVALLGRAAAHEHTDEAQLAQQQQCCTHFQQGNDDQRGQNVWQHVTNGGLCAGEPHGTRALDEGALAQDDKFAADVLGDLTPADNAQGNQKDDDATPDVQREDQQHAGQQQRDRCSDTDRAHDGLVAGLALVPAGDDAQNGAEKDARQRDEDCGNQCVARAVEQQAQDVPAPLIAAQRICLRGRKGG